MAYPNNNITDILCCGYLTTAKDGKIIFANQYLLELLEVNQNETLEKRFLTDFFSDQEKLYFEAHIKPLLQESGIVREINTELTSQKHKPVPVLLNAIILKNQEDGTDLIHYTFFDISRHKQYEFELLQAGERQKEVLSQLQESNHRVQKDNSYYKSIIANQSFYIIKTDLEGRYTYMNPYFCLILGIKEEEWIGKYSMELIVPEDHAICMEAVEKCFIKPREMQKVILRKPALGGVMISTQWEFSVLWDENDQMSEILCIGHDITPLIKRQKDLQTLVDITAGQNKRLMDFTYIVSHNIRSHVANLSGVLGVIDMDDEQDRNTSFELLKYSVGRLDETIHHLNDIISIQDNTNLPETMLTLKKEIEKVLQIIHITFTTSRASVVYNFDDEEQIYTNQAYFESILLNLLTNGIKYRSAERDPVIKISLGRKDGYIILTVQDNGLGIDLNRYRDQLFGMYNTFHGNKDAKGLGLFIVKSQIEALKGKIEVESELGTGTSFKVYFCEK